jgi:hypothetical protein
MPNIYAWLAWLCALVATYYFFLLLVAPRKSLFALIALIYAIAMFFISDGVGLKYGTGNLLYPALYTTVGIALILIVLLPIVDAIFRFILSPFIRDEGKWSRISDAIYWFAAGTLIALAFLEARLFARFSGTVLLPLLLATGLLALGLFFVLRSRGASRTLLFLMPGYALGISVLLASSLYHGNKVLPAAEALAKDTPFCIESGRSQVISVLDMTPLTLISREFSEYHAELIVETAPKPDIYNWSWRSLTFSPVKPDMYFARTCVRK